jgi:hypothetical protein
MQLMISSTNPPKDYIAQSGLPPSGSSSTECQRGKLIDLTTHVVLEVEGKAFKPSAHTVNGQLCGSLGGHLASCLYLIFGM